ncbi:MAG: hypothetical protein O7J95_07135 [Planctomycetota bacterium]|nr:hypothetical protein [Planctomycetota bacterium]
MNATADRLLAEVRQMLGDSRGEIANVSRDFFEQEKLKRELTRAEIRRAIARGIRYESEDEYDLALESYRRAKTMIRYEPFDLALDEEMREVELRIPEAEKGKARKDEEDRRERERMAQESLQADSHRSMAYVKNQIRQLYRRADTAKENKRFELAAQHYQQILQLNPRDERASRWLAVVKQQNRLQTLDDLMRRSVENYELAVLGVLESSVIYQKIFRYPEQEEWIRISPKVISIEERVAQAQTEEEKDIRRRLGLAYTFGVPEETSLQDVLAELQSLSGINFFIRPGEDGTDPGESAVQLDQLEGLPLRNILNLVLRQVGEDVRYIIKEGTVIIGPRGDLQETKYFYTYEISDLIRARPDFPAPDIGLDELAGTDSGGGAEIDLGFDEDEELSGAVLPAEDLLRIIAKALGGEEDVEEPEGIRIFGGKLSARVTLEDHLKLAKILERFRRSAGMMVTVESRFLDIQDNFLEEIGINFGGTTSNLPNTIPDADGTGTALAPGYEFIDARGEFNLRAASIGMLSNPLGSQVNPFNLSSSGGGAYQLNVLDAERFQLEAILTGVAKTQEIRRLNSPRITAFNTQVAHTLVVQQAAYIQDLEVNQTGVIPVINPVIGVLNTGSILELRPTISYDRKYVVLEIQPTLAEEIGRDVAVLNLSGSFTVVPVQLPILSVTKIKTTVTVPDGGTVLVGGLKREITTKSSIGMPFFRHIPLVNLLLGRKGASTLRSNLFVLINAQITIVHEEEEALFGPGVGAGF